MIIILSAIVVKTIERTDPARRGRHCIIYVFKGSLFFPVYNICLVDCRTHLQFRPKSYPKRQLTQYFEEKVISGNYVVHYSPEVKGETSNFWRIWGVFHKGSWSEWLFFVKIHFPTPKNLLLMLFLWLFQFSPNQNKNRVMFSCTQCRQLSWFFCNFYQIISIEIPFILQIQVVIHLQMLSLDPRSRRMAIFDEEFCHIVNS